MPDGTAATGARARKAMPHALHDLGTPAGHGTRLALARTIMPIEKGDVVSAIEEMNAALRLKFEAIRDLFSATAATDARARRELGASILDIKRAPGTYGTGSVALLARALGRDMCRFRPS